jgi:hypothetical protein
MIFSQYFHLFDFKAPKTSNTFANLNMTTNQLPFPTKLCIWNGTSANSLALDWAEHVSSCSAFSPFFSRESSIKSRLVIHTVANQPGWDLWLTKYITIWSTIKICLCSYPMTSYVSQSATGHGPLYIRLFRIYHHPKFQPKIFHMKNRKITWKLGTLLGYFAHPTSRARIRLPYPKSIVYSSLILYMNHKYPILPD